MTAIPNMQSVMTPSPHTVGLTIPLATAERLMREHGVRHLPVLEHGQVVGVLSQRDLAVVTSVGGTALDEATVEDAMTPDPYVVGPRASLAKVARHMAAHRLGCAVVADKGHVKGIFTTVDALGVLASLLEGGGNDGA